MFCLSPFLKIGTMFHSFQPSGNIPHFKQFWKEVYYSVAGHFQHANTDHIMSMGFIRIEFTDDSFNIILCEFDVFQVLISNGNSWWGENTVIFNNWALFSKKTIKKIDFFTKICNKFVIVENRRDARNFFSFNIVISNDQ